MLTKIAPIRAINSVWRRIRYIWVGMNLGQNSILPQFEGGGAQWSNTKKMPFLKRINRKSNLYSISKNQLPKSITRRDMGIYPLFDLEKCCSSPISPSNLVCTFSWSPRCSFWGSRLFSPISSSYSLKEVVFWPGFLIFSLFEFVPRITSLQTEQTKLKLSMHIK